MKSGAALKVQKIHKAVKHFSSKDLTMREKEDKNEEKKK